MINNRTTACKRSGYIMWLSKSVGLRNPRFYQSPWFSPPPGETERSGKKSEGDDR